MFDPYIFDAEIPDYFLELDDDLFDKDSPVDVRTQHWLRKNHNYLLARRLPRNIYTASFGGRSEDSGNDGSTAMGNVARFYGWDKTSIPGTQGTDMIAVDAVVNSFVDRLTWSFVALSNGGACKVVAWVRDTTGRIYAGNSTALASQNALYTNLTQYTIDLPLRSIGMPLSERGGRRVTVGLSMIEPELGSAIGTTYTVGSSSAHWVDVGVSTIFGNAFLDLGNTNADPHSIMRVDGNRIYTTSRMDVLPVPGNNLRVHVSSQILMQSVSLWEHRTSNFNRAQDIL